MTTQNTTTTIDTRVAEACTADLLQRLCDVREDRDTWRDMATAAIDKLARQTGIVTSQTATIRRLTAELRELRQPPSGRREAA